MRLIIFLCLVFRAAAATYYVDATNGLDANPGTLAQPWQTLAKIESAATADGDIVLLKRGETWTTPADASSTTTNRAMLRLSAMNMVLDAYGTGAAPVINGGGNCRNIITVNTGIYGTTTRNIKLYNAGNNASGNTGALWSGANGANTLEDCELDTHETDAGATTAIGSSALVQRCRIHNMYDDGVTCHGLNGVGSSIIIRQCLIYDCTFDGINHSVTNGGDITTLCEDTIFWGNNARDIGALDVGNHTFNRCRFGIRGGRVSAALIQATTEYSVTFNACVIDGANSTSLSIPSISIGGTCALAFNNCTFLGATSGSHTGQISAQNSGTVDFTNCIFSNWYRCGYIATGGIINATKCIFHATTLKTPTTNVSEVSTSDPLFVSPPNDLRLQSTSPAKFAGNNLSITLDRASYPFTATPSLGAYEYWTRTGSGTATSATVTSAKVAP